MEELITRFPHVAEQIFEQLNNISLTKCREVEKSWQTFIDDKNLPWIRIVNIPTTLRFGNTRGNTYLHVAVQKGQVAMFEYLFQKEEVKNPKNELGVTPFHNVCRLGHFKIAKILINKYHELENKSRNLLELNSKDNYGPDNGYEG